jgi:type II secretory pathway component PulF
MELSGDKPRHSVWGLVLLLGNMILAICVFMFLRFEVPVLVGMYKHSGVAVPAWARGLLVISNILMAFHGFILVCVLGLVVWAMIHAYRVLHQQGDERRLFGFLWIELICLVVINATLLFTMFLPCFVPDRDSVGASMQETKAP